MEDLHVCDNCGKTVEDSIEVCPYCDTPLKSENQESESVVDSEQNLNALDCGASSELPKTKKACKNNKPVMTHKQKCELIKKSIYLAVCTVLLILSFCPIVKIESLFGGDEYDSIETGYSGIDFFVIMCASACRYDQNADSAKLERLDRNYERAEEKFRQSNPSYILIKSEVRPTIKTAILNHNYKMAGMIYSYATVDMSVADGWRMLNLGVLSLLYITISCTMFAFSLIELLTVKNEITGKGSVRAKRFENYFYLAPVLLFLSLAIIINLMFGGFAISFILRMTVECGCIAFLLAKTWLATELKSDLKKKLSATITVALVILLVGCCFASWFESYSYKKDDGGNKYLYRIDRVDSQMFDSVNYAYLWLYNMHVGFGEDICKEIIEDYSFCTNTVNNTMYIQGKKGNVTEGGLKMLSTGKGFATLAILFGAFIVFVTFYPSEKMKKLKFAATILLFVCVLFAFALCVSVAAIVNDYMYGADLYQYRQSIGGGIACMVLFAIGLVVEHNLLERNCRLFKKYDPFYENTNSVAACLNHEKEEKQKRKQKRIATMKGKTKFRKKQ